MSSRRSQRKRSKQAKRRRRQLSWEWWAGLITRAWTWTSPLGCGTITRVAVAVTSAPAWTMTAFATTAASTWASASARVVGALRRLQRPRGRQRPRAVGARVALWPRPRGSQSPRGTTASVGVSAIKGDDGLSDRGRAIRGVQALEDRTTITCSCLLCSSLAMQDVRS